MRYFLLKMLLLSAAVSTVIAGCSGGQGQGGGTGGDRVELMVFAAASLSDSLGEIQPLFEARYPNVKVIYNFASSGTLQRQIEQGAPADAFISAGSAEMDALVERKLVRKESVQRFLGNRLAVIVPAASAERLERMDELAEERFATIAVGQPETVPAGKYAKQSLDSAGLWEPLSKKLVFGKDVRSVLSVVETGNADAGFVYVTDAQRSDQVRIAFLPDENGYEDIVYPMSVVEAAKHKAEADAFVEFLQENEAVEIFTKAGFMDLR